jgi:O-antigen/teichoic acid export membrane protein
VVTLVTIGYAWWLVHKRQLVDHKPEVMVTKGELIKNGRMFSMSMLFVGLYYYIDSVIIQHYWGFEQVGIYSSAYNLLVYLTAPMIIV